MNPLIGNSRTVKANLWAQILKQWLPGWRGERLTGRRHQGTFWSDGYVPHLDLEGGDMSTHVCQNATQVCT